MKPIKEDRERNVSYNKKKNTIGDFKTDARKDIPLYLQPKNQAEFRPYKDNCLSNNPNDNG